MPTQNEFLVKAQTVIAAIYANDFYVSQWERVKHTKPLAECNKAELLKPFQDFWELLPDSPVIHRPPFYSVCDLAEEFCFGEQ